MSIQEEDGHTAAQISFNVFLPIVAEQSGKKKPVPFGWAIYGADWPMVRHHALMKAGHRIHNWWAKGCCLEYPLYMPYIGNKPRSPQEIQALAAAYPGRTWCLWNEPDYVTQANISPAAALPYTLEWIDAIGENGRIAGYGVGLQPRYDGWRIWLDEFLALGAPLPDVWHMHIYATNAVEWYELYKEWQSWNSANGDLPTIISEAGGDLNEDGNTHGWYGIYHFLRQWIDDRVEGVYLFTNNPMLYQDIDV